MKDFLRLTVLLLVRLLIHSLMPTNVTMMLPLDLSLTLVLLLFQRVLGSLLRKILSIPFTFRVFNLKLSFVSYYEDANCKATIEGFHMRAGYCFEGTSSSYLYKQPNLVSFAASANCTGSSINTDLSSAINKCYAAGGPTLLSFQQYWSN